MGIIKNICFSSLFLILFSPVVGALEVKCVKCHQEVYSKIVSYRYQHSDFIQTECKGCHINGERVNLNTSIGTAGQGFAGWGRKNLNRGFGYRTPGEKKEEEKENIKWKKVSLKVYTNEHVAIFKIPSLNNPYNFRINISDRNGGKNRSEILEIIPSAVTESWVDDESTPQIFGVSVERVDLSVFATVYIAWETSELSNSRVEYGMSKEYGHIAGSGVFTRKHIVKLKGLNNNETYHFRVISKDPFGNKSVSNDFVFKTNKTFNLNVQNSVSLGSGRVKIQDKPEIIMTKILRLYNKKNNKNNKKEKSLPEQNKIAILFTSSREVISFIEYAKKETPKEGSVEAERHGQLGLKNRRMVTINLCKDCHRSGASHPVGMRGKGNVVIPDNLPTIDGGVMTCITCHTAHGSDIEHLMRFESKRNICVLCHLDKQ